MPNVTFLSSKARAEEGVVGCDRTEEIINGNGNSRIAQVAFFGNTRTMIKINCRIYWSPSKRDVK